MAATLGLGEAAVVRARRGAISRQGALEASLAAAGALSIIGCAIFVGLSVLRFSPDNDSLWLTIAAIAGTVVVGVFSDILSHGLLMEARVVEASVVALTVNILLVVGYCLFVVGADFGIPGAALASLCASLAGVLITAGLVRRNLSLRARWNVPYLRGALNYGVPMEVSYLLTTASVRIDLLIVFQLSGSVDAGLYSIAITLATLVGLVPFAISYASFPRLATLPREAIAGAAASLARLGFLGSALLAALLAIAAPLAIPVLFGDAFDSSATPTVLLLLGGAIASYQWILARSRSGGTNSADGFLLRHQPRDHGGPGFRTHTYIWP